METPETIAQRTPPRFDAFISYSHVADGDLAPALRRGLHQLGKPWYRTRAAKVFVDNASLSTNPALWTSITAALDGSRNFVLLCSPEAARSEWVDKEVAFWLAHKSASCLLPVLTDGELVWDAAARDIDFVRSTAVPPSLKGVFAEEPRHLDLRWTKDQSSAIALSLQNSQFKDAVADLAAPIHGVAKDDLVGEDIRQHRRTRTIARAAVATLTALLIAAVVSAVIARSNAVRAEHRRIDADAQRLGLEASSVPGPPDLAFTLAAEGFRLRATDATAEALTNAADAAPQLERLLHDHRVSVTALLAQPERHRVVSVDRDGVMLANDVRTGAVVARATTSTKRVFQLTSVPRGILVVGRDGTSVVDAGTLRAVANSATPSDAPLTGVAVVAGGVAVGDLGPGADVRGDLNWYGQDAKGAATTESVAKGIGTPVGIGVDGNAMVVLFSLPQEQEATLRRYTRVDGTWLEAWTTDVSSTSTVLRVGDDGTAAVGTVEGAIVLLDARTGVTRGTVSIGTSGVRTITPATDFALLLVGDATGTVHWVDPAARSVPYSWKVHGGPVTGIVSLSGSAYASAGDDGTVALQRIRPLRQVAGKTTTTGGSVFAIDAHPDRGIAYVGLEGAVETVDLKTRAVRSRTSGRGVVYAVAELPVTSAVGTSGSRSAPADPTIARGDTNGRIQLLRSGHVVQTVQTAAQTVLQLTPVPARHELLAVTDAGDLIAMPITAGRLGPSRSLATDVGVAFAVSSDGRWLAYPRFDQNIVVLRLADAMKVAEIESSGSVERLTFDATSALLAVGYDGSVATWQLDLDRSPARIRRGPEVALTAKPTALAFADGQLLVADTDSVVTIWDARTGQSRGSIGASNDSRAADLAHGLASAFVSAGDLLVERDLRVGAVARSACAVLGRTLTEPERTRFGVDSTESPCREGT